MSRARCGLLGPARVCVLLVATARVVGAAPDQDPARAEARALAYSGVEAYAIEDYPAASAKLEAAYRLLQVPSLGLWSARALVKLGKWTEAEERYRAVSAMQVSPSDPPVQQRAKLDATRELGELLPRIPTMTLRLSGATADEVEIEIDGRRVSAADRERPQLVNPGQRYTVVGKRGSERPEIVLNIEEGRHEEVWLHFNPVAAPLERNSSSMHAAEWEVDDSSRVLRTGGWLALTAGGAAFATSLVAYFLARDKYDDLEQRNLCVDRGCSPAEVDAYNTWRTLHIVGLISGGVLGVAGVSVLLATPSPASATERGGLTLQLGPGSAAVRGNF